MTEDTSVGPQIQDPFERVRIQDSVTEGGIGSPRSLALGNSAPIVRLGKVLASRTLSASTSETWDDNWVMLSSGFLVELRNAFVHPFFLHFSSRYFAEMTRNKTYFGGNNKTEVTMTRLHYVQQNTNTKLTSNHKWSLSSRYM